MGYPASKVIEIALSFVGYHEKASNSQLEDFHANAGRNNFVIFWEWLHKAGYYQAYKQGQEWCDGFHDAVHLIAAEGDAAEAQRVTCQTGPYGAAVPFSMGYYEAQGRLFDYPMPGDQPSMYNKGHTGIVIEVDDETVWIAEGNSNNKVELNPYNIHGPELDGKYGRPWYDPEPEEEEIMYNTIEEVPEYAKPTIQKLMDKGALQGKANGDLALSEDMIRILVIHDRMGLYGI